jgi:hypothetical protein
MRFWKTLRWTCSILFVLLVVLSSLQSTSSGNGVQPLPTASPIVR